MWARIGMVGVGVGLAAAASAGELTTQGRVLDATGVPINGDHAVVVTLYAAGASVHTASFGAVTFQDGYFTLRLTGVPDSALAAVDEMGLALDGGAELTPRQPVGAVPRAATAGVGLVDLGGGVRGWADGTFAGSCEEYRRPPGGYAYVGATGDGVYRIDPDGPDPASLPAYDATCLMTEHGGGWTRILRIAPGINTGTILTNVPKTQERVSIGDWDYSNDLLRNSGREVLIREDGTPYRTHRYRFDAYCDVSDETFIGLLTGDLSSVCTAVWNWVDKTYVSHAVSRVTGYDGGRCNVNNHSQWNCEPAYGVRFHYGTRDYNGDGGGNSPGDGDAWGWFTGYNTGFGDYGKLVLNWNGVYDKTPHSLYVR